MAEVPNFLWSFFSINLPRWQSWGPRRRSIQPRKYCAGATCRRCIWPTVVTLPASPACYRAELPSCPRISFWPCPPPTASISNGACRIEYLGRRAWTAPTDSTSDTSFPQCHRRAPGVPHECPPVLHCCAATWTCTWSNSMCLSHSPAPLHRSGSLSDHLQVYRSLFIHIFFFFGSLIIVVKI